MGLLTQKEIQEILETYSTRKKEFRLVSEKSHSYLSKYLKEYMISIEEEIDIYSGKQTGRILVFHTQYGGKCTFRDTWERDKNGCLFFKYRNTPDEPISDVNAIQYLKEEIAMLKEAGKKILKDPKVPYVVKGTAQQQIEELKSSLALSRGIYDILLEHYRKLNFDKTQQFKSTSLYQEMVQDLEQYKAQKDAVEQLLANADERENALQNKVQELLAENERLKKVIKETAPSLPQHNARGAGRKKGDEKWQKRFEEFSALMQQGVEQGVIIERMHISVSTFYRLHKIYKEKID